jgi:hypothetical protein
MPPIPRGFIVLALVAGVTAAEAEGTAVPEKLLRCGFDSRPGLAMNDNREKTFFDLLTSQDRDLQIVFAITDMEVNLYDRPIGKRTLPNAYRSFIDNLNAVFHPDSIESWRWPSRAMGRTIPN